MWSLDQLLKFTEDIVKLSRENKMVYVSPSLLEIAFNLVDQILQSQSKYWENIFKIFNNIMSTRDALKK